MIIYLISKDIAGLDLIYLDWIGLDLDKDFNDYH